MASSSWSCKGCTNTVDMITPENEVRTYCREAVEKGRIPTRWRGDHVYCTAYTTDPRARIKNIRMDFIASEEGKI